MEDKRVFDRFYSKHKPVISEFTFTNIFCWRRQREHEYALVDGHLVVRFRMGKRMVFYQPAGKDPGSVMKRVLEMFPGSGFLRVEKSVAESLIGGSYAVSSDRDNFDYVYDVKELVQLKGNKFEPKRNFIKQVMRHEPEV